MFIGRCEKGGPAIAAEFVLGFAHFAASLAQGA
jgi:hypothetical protein